MSTPRPPAEAQAVRDLAAAYEQMTEQIGRVIVGQQEVIEQLLMALFSRGHCLLVGVPGLAKTLLVSTVSKILHLSFKRIQFTPDLMPADITGTDILPYDPETARPRSVSLLAQPPLVLPAGDDRRQHLPPQRDYPPPAQAPARSGRGQAGAPRHRRPPAVPAARAVLRPGDAEPDRAGRHLPAARSAARPLH